MGATTTAKFQARRFDVTDKDLGDLLLHTLRAKLGAMGLSLAEKSRELSVKSDKIRKAYDERVTAYAIKEASGSKVKRALGPLFSKLRFDSSSIGYYPPKRITLSFVSNGTNVSQLVEPTVSKSAVQLDIPYPAGYEKHTGEMKEIEVRNIEVCKRKDKIASLTSNHVINNNDQTFLESEVRAQVVRWKLSKLKDDGIDFDPVALSEAFIKEKLEL